MRTTNQHPQWCNEPLRLNAEEREDPARVFQEFFKCFHLQEVRQVLWEWMVETVVSDRCGGHDSQERSSAIFFYEKMEELVEAAFLMNRKKGAGNEL